MIRRLIAGVVLVTMLIGGVAFAEYMDRERAISILSEEAPSTLEAYDYTVYPSGDEYAAWVLCVNGDSGKYRKGTIWYVSEDGVEKLGSGSKIVDFMLFTDHSPEVCACVFNEDGRNKVHLAVATDAGAVQAKGAETFTDVKSYEGALYGVKKGNDRIFIDVDASGNLMEIVAEKLSPADIEGSKYAQVFGDVVEAIMASYDVTKVESYLYYDTGVMAINFKCGNKKYHTYVYKSRKGAVTEQDWDGQVIAYSGFATGGKKTSLNKRQSVFFTFETETAEDDDYVPFWME